ncbi:hypothetical protein [Serratia nevei]|uniref:hypothetical protein n=1 Tax=Serratia nevei TaxID=2703794 RepID=UPI00249CDEE5|nr:hypothetical protein [Serratia nevei]MDI3149334.1 hypothetical protein [Serratia nevei]
MTLATERQQFAEQNEMSLDFVNWFFDEKKESCGNAWFIMAAAMWEGWKGRPNLEVQPVAVDIEHDALRYRFLRDKDAFGDDDEPGLVGWDGLVELGYNEFDAAIDARIAHPNIDYAKLDNALKNHERRRCKDKNCNAPIIGYSVDGFCENCYIAVSQQPAPAVPPGYRLQPISEYDAICEYVRGAPPAPAVPGELLDAMDEVVRISDREHDAWVRAKEAITACRAAMLGNIDKPAPQLDSVVTRHADQSVGGGYMVPDGFKLMPLEITDEIAEAIAMEARCCGGIALCIYEAALAATPGES